MSSDGLLAAVKNESLGGVNDVLNPSIRELGKPQCNVQGLEGLMNIRSLDGDATPSNIPKCSSLIVDLMEESTTGTRPLPKSIDDAELHSEPHAKSRYAALHATPTSTTTIPLPSRPVFSCPLSRDVFLYSDSKTLQILVVPKRKSYAVPFPLPEGCTIRGVKPQAGTKVKLAIAKLCSGGKWDAWKMYDVEDVDFEVDVERLIGEGSSEVEIKTTKLVLESWWIGTFVAGTLAAGVALGVAAGMHRRKK